MKKQLTFTLFYLEGNPVSSSEYKRSYVVIHIATTCPFCNAVAPYLEQLNQDTVKQI